MTDDGTDSVMRRKAGAGRPPPEIGQITTSSVLHTALAQGAEDALGLVASVAAFDEGRVTVSSFMQDLPENVLLGLCERGQEEFGMVILDQESLAALIEIQTMGRVAPTPAAARAPTRTDALLCADFINQILLLFAQGTTDAALPIAPSVTGYHYIQPLADLRAVEMTLADCPYNLFTIKIDFSDGAKTGEMRILLPLCEAAPEVQKINIAWENDLANLVGGTHAEVEAVLARKELSLSEVTALQVGSIITLPREVVSQILLVDMDGEGITFGRLGQASGMRAVCITEPFSQTNGISSGAEGPTQLQMVDAIIDRAPMIDLESQPAPTPPDTPSNQEPLGDGGAKSGMPDMQNV